MADLTRFDFHVLRFMKSLDVMAMSAEEVGQYILLLSESWLIGDACTLPNEPKLLARLARVNTVAPIVMKKFPVSDTEFGPRRRNPVLHQEWIKTVERTTCASESGKAGAAARWGGYSNPSGDPIGGPIDAPIAQTKPSQAVPNQSNQSNGASDFKNLAIRYRRTFATRLSGSKNVRQRYAEACRTYGESIVLEMFDNWSATAGWIKDWAAEGKLRTDGLKGFYESLPEQIEIETAAKSEQVATQSAVSDREADIERQLVESHAKFVEKQQKVREEIEEEEAAAKRIRDNPAGFFGKVQ
jgi:hypothetical protein